MTGTPLPQDSYLAIYYRDRQRGQETESIYYEDGRVEAFNGQKRWLVCAFSGSQVERAKAAIRSSGLLEAPELNAEGFYDTAGYTYVWNVDGQHGQVSNWAYPARSHPAFDSLERQLNELEVEARDL